MAYSTIPKGSLYINTKLYTGDSGTSNSITGVGFQPDMVWIKIRTGSGNHFLWDAVRGANKTIVPNDTDAEATSDYLGSFDSDGFTLTSASNNTNSSSYNYASWNWKANGQGSSNTDGSINTTYTSVNTTAGFSICKWTGTGSAGTIGHGLGVTPGMIIFKNLSSTNGWIVWNKSFNARTRCTLNTNAAASTSQVNFMNDTLPTSSLIYLGNDSDTNGSGNQMIAYVFAEKTGYSKFNSYGGNGDANGPMVYTGFKPSWIMIKRTDSTNNWIMLNNKMSLYNNNTGDELYADAASQQNSFVDGGADFLSNGFKLRGTNASVNFSGGSYIYMCFAENPFVATSGSTAVPVTAR